MHRFPSPSPCHPPKIEYKYKCLKNINESKDDQNALKHQNKQYNFSPNYVPPPHIFISLAMFIYYGGTWRIKCNVGAMKCKSLFDCSAKAVDFLIWVSSISMSEGCAAHTSQVAMLALVGNIMVTWLLVLMRVQGLELTNMRIGATINNLNPEQFNSKISAQIENTLYEIYKLCEFLSKGPIRFVRSMRNYPLFSKL